MVVLNKWRKDLVFGDFTSPYSSCPLAPLRLKSLGAYLVVAEVRGTFQLPIFIQTLEPVSVWGRVCLAQHVPLSSRLLTEVFLSIYQSTHRQIHIICVYVYTCICVYICTYVHFFSLAFNDFCFLFVWNHEMFSHVFASNNDVWLLRFGVNRGVVLYLFYHMLNVRYKCQLACFLLSFLPSFLYPSLPSLDL